MNPTNIIKSLLRNFLYSVWVPVSVMFIAWVRIGLFSTLEPADHPSMSVTFLNFQSIMLLLVSWVCGMVITLALQMLFKRSRKAAFFAAVFTVPLTAILVLFGGLFGGIGIAFAVVLASLPIWLIIAIIRLIQTRQQMSQQN